MHSFARLRHEGEEREAAAGARRPPLRHGFQTAYHEAGHGAAALLLGLPLAGMTLEFIDGHHGRCWGSDDCPVPAETVADVCAELTPLLPGIGDDRADIAKELLRAGHQVIALLAGVEAERLFCGELLPDTEHDEVDAASIAGLVVRSVDAVAAYIEFCRAEARALLRANSEMVHAISDGLVAHRILLRHDIDKIVARLGEAAMGAAPHLHRSTRGPIRRTGEACAGADIVACSRPKSGS